MYQSAIASPPRKMKVENGGTSPAKKKWTKKGYNPEEWRPDLAGVSEVAPCSLCGMLQAWL